MSYAESSRHVQNTPHAGGTPNPGGAPNTGDRTINWAVVLGLSTLGLLWPLAELTGMPDGPARALVLLAITGVCWIGVVGFGGFPRPVLTLVLVGIGTGLVWQMFGVVFGQAGLRTLPYTLAMQAGWGALAGLIAAGIRNSRR